METQESNHVALTERDKQHERLMRAVLNNLVETPLVLKGGTALYLGYGLNRFSEDLDFDSDKKLNLVIFLLFFLLHQLLQIIFLILPY